MIFHKKNLSSQEIKSKARELGADLVGIADGAAVDTSHITALDGGRVIVLAKRLNEGVARIRRWDDRHKYYNDELTLTHLEETSLELVYWLEDCGYPALIVPPTHVAPSSYQGDPDAHLEPVLSLTHAAVEAGLGTLGLNLQLLTPEYGPRVLLAAVLCSVDVECDRPIAQALCKGPACGRCLKVCPADAVKEWDRDWASCDRYRSPHGFAQLSEHLMKFAREDDAAKRKQLLRSEDSFNLWQSILRGAGVVTGCRRCADVCPVGQDYEKMLADAHGEIPENTPAKDARLKAMTGGVPDEKKRYIGIFNAGTSEKQG
jgi:epoxyqueuosine reductase QueG